MSTDVLILIVLGALTLVAYIIALNSHGPTRLAISYLLATIILIASVWSTVQYVNSGNHKEFKELMEAKKKAEELMKSQQDATKRAIQESNERLSIASKLNGVINKGINFATTIMNSNMRDNDKDLDDLIAKAKEIKRKVEELVAEFDKLRITDTLFAQSTSLVKESLKQLTEAAQYNVLYYYAEDDAQEELRERILRQRATSSHDLLQKASTLITPSNN